MRALHGGSELEGVGHGGGDDGLRGERWLPWAEQRVVGDLRDVDGRAGHLEDLQDAAERLEAPGELAVAGAEHRVLAVDLAQLPRVGPDLRLDARVVGLEARRLGDQLLQPLLLPRPGPPRRLPVRQHPLPLPLVGGVPTTAAAAGVALRAGAPARRRRHGHSTVLVQNLIQEPDLFKRSKKSKENKKETSRRMKKKSRSNQLEAGDGVLGRRAMSS